MRSKNCTQLIGAGLRALPSQTNDVKICRCANVHLRWHRCSYTRGTVTWRHNNGHRVAPSLLSAVHFTAVLLSRWKMFVSNACIILYYYLLCARRVIITWKIRQTSFYYCNNYNTAVRPVKETVCARVCRYVWSGRGIIKIARASHDTGGLLACSVFLRIYPQKICNQWNGGGSVLCIII